MEQAGTNSMIGEEGFTRLVPRSTGRVRGMPEGA